MSDPEKFVQVILNIGAEGDLSQAEVDALLKELEARVGQQVSGSVEIMMPPEGSQSKDPLTLTTTLAIAVIQHAVPKLLDLIFDIIRERRNRQMQVFAKVGNEQITIDSHTDPVELQAIQERVKAAGSGDEMPERRFALLVGTTNYEDSRLNQLASPAVDVQALADVLKDPNIGGYDDVKLLLNESSLAISQAVEQFFKKKASTDLLLLYFSGHGVRDENEELYLAVQNTDLELLRATAVPSNFINVLMDRSKSERQVLILDCCYSGAFLSGASAQVNKGTIGAVDVPVHAANAFKGNGYGRVVLTATDKTQVAWEGQKFMGQVQKSVFTHHLIEGLTTGEADQDSDGWIGLDELYKYVFNRMIKTSPQQSQTPEMTAFHMKGNIILAKNPKPKPANLPAELHGLITHPYADVRLTAVNRLKELFNESPYGVALAARKALEKLSRDDSRMVSEAAAKALGILPSESTAPAVNEPPPSSETKPIPPVSSIPITQPRPGESAQEGVRVSPGAAWWTQPHLKPLPGTRTAGGTKSGPSQVQEFSTRPVENSSAPIPNGLASPSSGLSNPAHPSFHSLSAHKTSSWQESDTRALLAGILSLLLFFLPVSIWGFTIGLRAIRTIPHSPRAIAGLVLSGITIAIQLILLLVALMSI